MQRIYIDIRNINLGENILDVCLGGSSIINEIINQKKIDVEKRLLYLKNFNSTLNKYDTCIFLFTLSKGITKYRFSRLIKKISSRLNKGSKLYIWDVVLDKTIVYKKYNISVETHFGIKNIPLRIIFNPFRIGIIDILKTLENNNYKIISSVLNADTFFIEAEYNGEEKNKQNEGYISSIKCKICSFKFSNKIFKKRNRR